jgi:hypothetical protein
MNITCQDRERILQHRTAEDWAALELHAESCAKCSEELLAWKNLSVAAQQMGEETDSPLLWARIEAALREQTASGRSPDSPWQRLKNWAWHSVGWQTALAGTVVLALAVLAGYLYSYRGRVDRKDRNVALLESPALRDVENSEHAYEQAIEHLAAEAKPQLENAESPLVASYREKLMVLDGAIDELRMQAGQNPSNAHLRRQLLAMYQEKQQTLQDVLEIKR